MGKFNPKVKGKEKKELKEKQKEFNPSARDPYIQSKRKGKFPDILEEEIEKMEDKKKQEVLRKFIEEVFELKELTKKARKKLHKSKESFISSF